jgi:hypothetical protein
MLQNTSAQLKLLNTKEIYSDYVIFRHAELLSMPEIDMQDKTWRRLKELYCNKWIYS